MYTAAPMFFGSFQQFLPAILLAASWKGFAHFQTGAVVNALLAQN